MAATFLVGAFLGALVVTFIFTSLVNGVLKRPLLSGFIVAAVASLLGYFGGRIHEPIVFVFYWLNAGLSALILRSRAKKAEAATPAAPP
jgi:uncharacterized membrane protein YfcA